jgi:hypothetical protein
LLFQKARKFGKFAHHCPINGFTLPVTYGRNSPAKTGYLHQQFVINRLSGTLAGMVEADNKLILENLKKIQAGVVDLRNGQADLRQEMRDLKEAQISTREEIQALAVYAKNAALPPCNSTWIR